MVITARLSRSLHQTLGEEAADDLVNWMALVESNRSELRELMDVHNARIDAKFAAAEHALDARFAKADQANEARFGTGALAIEARFALFAALAGVLK